MQLNHMFDVGFWELMIIGVVALLVIGPERLPSLARKAGYWVARIRRFVAQVKVDVDKELRAEEIKQAIERNAGLDEIKEIIRRGQDDLDKVTQPDYLVKAQDDKPVSTSAKLSDDSETHGSETSAGQKSS